MIDRSFMREILDGEARFRAMRALPSENKTLDEREAMNLFEVSLFNDAPDPVGKVFCSDLPAARRYIEEQLKARPSEIYTATVWNQDPKTFLCFYMNDRDELFCFMDPMILTRQQAGKLRRGT